MSAAATVARYYAWYREGATINDVMVAGTMIPRGTKRDDAYGPDGFRRATRRGEGETEAEAVAAAREDWAAWEREATAED